MTREERQELFIRQSSAMPEHCDIDYSKVVYVDNRTPVELYDRGKRGNGEDFGTFWQTPANHLKGRCHPDRRNAKISENKRLSQDDVIERFKQVHKGENLDYSKVKYVNMHTEVCIVSHDTDRNGVEYGEFWQTPANHLKGCTHPRIAIDRVSQCRMLTNEEFIGRLQSIHSERDYDYSAVDYKGEHSMVTIRCNRVGSDGKPHGAFVMDASNLLAGKGCPKCGNHLSYAEDEIVQFLKTLEPSLTVKKHARDIIPPLEVDIVFPEHNVAVEYDGLRWHGERFGKGRDYHLHKTEECNKQGLALLHVFEDEYTHRKEVVLEKIARTLRIGQDRIVKIHGRKCNVRQIDAQTAKRFLNANHLQGFKGATVHYGADYNGELVGVMSFINVAGEWELCRFATSLWHSVRGLGGKIFKVFLNDYKPSKVKSFADRRWTSNKDNNLYTSLGFVLEGVVKPDYWYCDIDSRCKRLHKFGLRKKTLIRRYGFPTGMTEREMAEIAGYDRIWDCGLLKYVYHND